MVAQAAVLACVGGGQERRHEDLAGLLVHRFTQFREGQAEYATAATGPSSSRQTVSFGLRMLHFDGVAVVVLRRAPNRMFGRESASLEILCTEAAVAADFLAALQRLMTELSVVLKRGVLLYGPPGTGKTLTVRHLLGATPEATAVVLQGGSLAYVGEAARLARALAPAIVVLEDVDLVAMERGTFGGPQPLLFEILDAMDGVDGDTDIAFVLTTNRAEILEPALAARPGRVDMAVEIPLPDAAARRALFRMYGPEVPSAAKHSTPPQTSQRA